MAAPETPNFMIVAQAAKGQAKAPATTTAPAAKTTPPAKATASTAVPAKAAESAFPPFDTTTFPAQLVWLAVAFGFLYVFLRRVALPGLSEVIAERQSRIARDLGEAERLKGETDKALASYEQALAEAKAKAGSIAKDTRDRLTQEVDKERATVDRTVASKVADAERRIAATKAQALSTVGDIATDTASAIVERLTGKSVAAGDVRKILATVGK
jgi:F-type H+-transporting ATPase subunit b